MEWRRDRDTRFQLGKSAKCSFGFFESSISASSSLPLCLYGELGRNKSTATPRRDAKFSNNDDILIQHFTPRKSNILWSFLYFSSCSSSTKKLDANNDNDATASSLQPLPKQQQPPRCLPVCKKIAMIMFLFALHLIERFQDPDILVVIAAKASLVISSTESQTASVTTLLEELNLIVKKTITTRIITSSSA
ncbi:hypothetical protein PIB30_026359 [Stylosanthes scabra]|uniref:Uncharacterized protein n=1 Tax=Stylosanthes scabra TaxID=79078 RepID=A0ABU6Z9F3_9FABA|nr:hypothetical protein [Stylosanthes scabra]